jgi:hypothetical protein
MAGRAHPMVLIVSALAPVVLLNIKFAISATPAHSIQLFIRYVITAMQIRADKIEKLSYLRAETLLVIQGNEL